MMQPCPVSPRIGWQSRTETYGGLSGWNRQLDGSIRSISCDHGAAWLQCYSTSMNARTLQCSIFVRIWPWNKIILSNLPTVQHKVVNTPYMSVGLYSNTLLLRIAVTEKSTTLHIRSTVGIRAEKPRFLKKVFRFLGFIGFVVQRPNTTVRPKSTWETITSHTWYALPLLTDYSILNYKHQALLYLLNYTIKIKFYIGLLRFLKVYF